jgi:hypothetical protein
MTIKYERNEGIEEGEESSWVVEKTERTATTARSCSR